MLRRTGFGAMVIGVLLLLPALFGCTAAGPSGAQAEASVPAPLGLARVWVLRQFEPGENVGRSPWVYVNGTALSQAAAGTVFYRDLAPGTYTFSVETCGRDTNQAQTLGLTPGTQTFLEIQSLVSFTPGDCLPPETFYVRQIQPRWAQLYLPQLAYLGPR